jgi:hypothetical protein
MKNIRLESEYLIARWLTCRDAVRPQVAMVSGDWFLTWRFGSRSGRQAYAEKLDESYAQVADLQWHGEQDPFGAGFSASDDVLLLAINQQDCW